MATIRQQRAGDRVLGTWDGRYRVDHRGPWGDCTIVDLSVGGTGILIPPGHETPDLWVHVDVRQVVGRRRPFVFLGAVRNVRTLADGWQRLAVQFVDVSARRERTLERLLDRWR